MTFDDLKQLLGRVPFTATESEKPRDRRELLEAVWSQVQDHRQHCKNRFKISSKRDLQRFNVRKLLAVSEALSSREQDISADFMKMADVRRVNEAGSKWIVRNAKTRDVVHSEAGVPTDETLTTLGQTYSKDRLEVVNPEGLRAATISAGKLRWFKKGNWKAVTEAESFIKELNPITPATKIAGVTGWQVYVRKEGQDHILYHRRYDEQTPGGEPRFLAVYEDGTYKAWKSKPARGIIPGYAQYDKPDFEGTLQQAAQEGRIRENHPNFAPAISKALRAAGLVSKDFVIMTDDDDPYRTAEYQLVFDAEGALDAFDKVEDTFWMELTKSVQSKGYALSPQSGHGSQGTLNLWFDRASTNEDFGLPRREYGPGSGAPSDYKVELDYDRGPLTGSAAGSFRFGSDPRTFTFQAGKDHYTGKFLNRAPSNLDPAGVYGGELHFSGGPFNTATLSVDSSGLDESSKDRAEEIIHFLQDKLGKRVSVTYMKQGDGSTWTATAGNKTAEFTAATADYPVAKIAAKLSYQLKPGSQTEAVTQGQYFVVIDTSVAGGKMVNNELYHGTTKADAEAARRTAKGEKVQVVDAVWFRPAQELMKNLGMTEAGPEQRKAKKAQALDILGKKGKEIAKDSEPFYAVYDKPEDAQDAYFQAVMAGLDASTDGYVVKIFIESRIGRAKDQAISEQSEHPLVGQRRSIQRTVAYDGVIKAGTYPIVHVNPKTGEIGMKVDYDPEERIGWDVSDDDPGDGVLVYFDPADVYESRVREGGSQRLKYKLHEAASTPLEKLFNEIENTWYDGALSDVPLGNWAGMMAWKTGDTKFLDRLVKEAQSMGIEMSDKDKAQILDNAGVIVFEGPQGKGVELSFYRDPKLLQKIWQRIERDAEQGVFESQIKCPKCKSKNVMTESGPFKCFGCGYAGTLKEGIVDNTLEDLRSRWDSPELASLKARLNLEIPEDYLELDQADRWDVQGFVQAMKMSGEDDYDEPEWDSDDPSSSNIGAGSYRESVHDIFQQVVGRKLKEDSLDDFDYGHARTIKEEEDTEKDVSMIPYMWSEFDLSDKPPLFGSEYGEKEQQLVDYLGTRLVHFVDNEGAEEYFPSDEFVGADVPGIDQLLDDFQKESGEIPDLQFGTINGHKVVVDNDGSGFSIAVFTAAPFQVKVPEFEEPGDWSYQKSSESAHDTFMKVAVNESAWVSAVVSTLGKGDVLLRGGDDEAVVIRVDPRGDHIKVTYRYDDGTTETRMWPRGETVIAKDPIDTNEASSMGLSGIYDDLYKLLKEIRDGEGWITPEHAKTTVLARLGDDIEDRHPGIVGTFLEILSNQGLLRGEDGKKASASFEPWHKQGYSLAYEGRRRIKENYDSADLQDRIKAYASDAESEGEEAALNFLIDILNQRYPETVSDQTLQDLADEAAQEIGLADSFYHDMVDGLGLFAGEEATLRYQIPDTADISEHLAPLYHRLGEIAPIDRQPVLSGPSVRNLAQRAIKVARSGEGVEELETEQGQSLSSLLDQLWDAAEERGMTDLVPELEKAYNDLVGTSESRAARGKGLSLNSVLEAAEKVSVTGPRGKLTWDPATQVVEFYDPKRPVTPKSTAYHQKLVQPDGRVKVVYSPDNRQWASGSTMFASPKIEMLIDPKTLAYEATIRTVHYSKAPNPPEDTVETFSGTWVPHKRVEIGEHTATNGMALSRKVFQAMRALGHVSEAKRKLNQKDYEFYIVKNNKIMSGWSYRDDAKEELDQLDDKTGSKVFAKKHVVTKLKLDPDDNASWSGKNEGRLREEDKDERRFVFKDGMAASRWLQQIQRSSGQGTLKGIDDKDLTSATAGNLDQSSWDYLSTGKYPKGVVSFALASQGDLPLTVSKDGAVGQAEPKNKMDILWDIYQQTLDYDEFYGPGKPTESKIKEEHPGKKEEVYADYDEEQQGWYLFGLDSGHAYQDFPDQQAAETAADEWNKGSVGEAEDTFKCPECGSKVLAKTGYCVKCKKKVKAPGKKDEATTGTFQVKVASKKLGKDRVYTVKAKDYDEATKIAKGWFRRDFKEPGKVQENKMKEAIDTTYQKGNKVLVFAGITNKNGVDEVYATISGPGADDTYTVALEDGTTASLKPEQFRYIGEAKVVITHETVHKFLD